MRACTVPLPLSASRLALTPFPARFLGLIPVRLSPLSSIHSSLKLLLLSQPKFTPSFSTSDSTQLESDEDDGSFDNVEDDDDDDYLLLDEELESLAGDGLCIEVSKVGRNSRRIQSKINIDASLDAVWSILTDYEKLADFIPGLAVSKLVEKRDKFARLYQIGQQNLPLGLKFNAKGVLDCYEKDLEILPSGKRREIEFKMVEGDFQCFEGKWSIEQLNRRKCQDSEGSNGQEFQTTLSYSVDVKPKIWLPVRLVEGRLCGEIKTNLSCIREEAKRVIDALRSL